MAGVWVTAGAPLETSDGWRVWYSWPQGDPPEQTPVVRTADGRPQQIALGPWERKLVEGSARQMGVRELRITDATPGALYEIAFPQRTVYWRTLPAELPLNLLIGSCFWLNDDRDGFYSAAVTELVQRERPAFKILMGDQLYADVWAPKPLNLRKGLAAKYERYWGDPAYQELLCACPNLVACDDHEFWNDFPEPQLQVPYSWDRFGPDNAQACKDLFDAYQAALNPQGKRYVRLLAGGVSFFVADTRSERTKDSVPEARLASPQMWADLEQWAKELKGPGVLVLPQPLLKTGGSKTDRTLQDFKEADRLGQIFENALGGKTADAKPHDILILTGDIHTGRISSAEIVGSPGTVYELVASPASLVTPFLPPWGHKPNPLPDRFTLNRRTWKVTANRTLSATVDNNMGLIQIAPGRNGTTRFSLQLWRIRPLIGIGKRILGRRPGKGAQPLHDPLELELR